MFEIVSPGGTPFAKYAAGSGGVKRGQLVKAASKKAVPIAADHSGATILGVAMNDAAETEIVNIARVGGQVLRVPFIPGSKTAFAATDIGGVFDVAVDGTTKVMTLDPDDTTGPLVVIGYDNENKYAMVTVDATVLFNV